MKVKEIMHTEVITVHLEDNLKTALDLMNENEINGAPVVDKNGKLAGVVVKADIYRFLIEEGHYDTYPIHSIMTRNVVTAQKDEEIVEVAKKLVKKDIVSIPIVEGDEVVGMISLENIVEHFISVTSVNSNQ